jgi:hypothetical protein
MNDNFQNTDYGDEIISWLVPEYEKHERSKQWYIIAGSISFTLLILSFFTNNFLFAVIIIIAVFITILRDGQEPLKVLFSITDEGVEIGKKFYDYDEIKDFSIIYKPKMEVKNLYFEFKNPIKPRLSIPLYDVDPLQIRETLLKYLTEDLDRTDQPVSEAFGKLLKL